MPDRNPFIPSERVADRKEGTTIGQSESKEQFRRQRAEEERKAREHPEPEQINDEESADDDEDAHDEEEE